MTVAIGISLRPRDTVPDDPIPGCVVWGPGDPPVYAAIEIAEYDNLSRAADRRSLGREIRIRSRTTADRLMVYLGDTAPPDLLVFLRAWAEGDASIPDPAIPVTPHGSGARIPHRGRGPAEAPSTNPSPRAPVVSLDDRRRGIRLVPMPAADDDRRDGDAHSGIEPPRGASLLPRDAEPEPDDTDDRPRADTGVVTDVARATVMAPSPPVTTVGAAPAPLEPLPPRSSPALVWDADLDSLPDLEWLIDGVLPIDALSLLIGEPGVGKSFLALGLAYAVGSGAPTWLGRRIARHGPVIYIAGEGQAGLKGRARAWKRAHGIDRAHVGYWRRPLSLIAHDELTDLIDQVRAALGDTAPALIVLDTFANCSTGADENSARDVGLCLYGARRIGTELGAAVLLVHHTLKNGSGKGRPIERGSGALKGAVDLMVSLTKAGDGIVLICEKTRDAEPFPRIALRLDTVPIDADQSSCVMTLRAGADAAGAVSSSGSTVRLTPAQWSVLRLVEGHGPAPRKALLAVLPDALKPGTFNNACGVLDTRGYLARNAPEGYALTDRGRQLLAGRSGDGSSSPVVTEDRADTAGPQSPSSAGAPLSPRTTGRRPRRGRKTVTGR